MTGPAGRRDGKARPDAGPGLSRRHALSFGAAFAALAQATPLPQPNLIVSGPVAGPIEPWEQLVRAAIDRLLSADQSLTVSHLGGADGVTAANTFDARALPDGATALLVSGAPAIAWLVGDPRAQFDVGHWLPVATGLVPGLVVRGPKPLTRTGRARLAIHTPAALALPATLGLSLLGTECAAPLEAGDPVAAVLAGAADAAFLHGSGAARLAQAAFGAGLQPVFSLGASHEGAESAREPAFADVPTLPELVAQQAETRETAALLGGWRALAAAAQIEFALVLPWLTPAGTVAWWRKAGLQIAAISQGSGPAMAARLDGGLRLQTDPAANFGLAPLAIDAAASLALRRWISARM